MTDTEPTPEQIAAWHKYEHVRKGGLFNMYDPRARQATGLARDEYLYCMKHYSSLREAITAGVTKL